MSGPSALLTEPHHDGSARYVVDDAPALGDTVPVFVRVPHADGANRLWVRFPHDAEPVFAEGTVDRTTATETWWRFDVEVRNPLTNYRFLLDGGPRGYRWLNGTGSHARDVTDASDFRLSASAPPPAWARDAVVYQIFPDRFARSTAAGDRPTPGWAQPASWDETVAYEGRSTPLQLFGGDLDGVAEHLDHVASLGADTIYVTPFFPAESNHRYNASDFSRVDPLLGGNEALARLSTAVHERGWRLIGDLTTNHCGDTHEWFRRALADPAAPERDFFYVIDPESFTAGDTLAYESWLGCVTLPKLSYSSPLLRDLLLRGPGSVAGHWLQEPYSLDGWRVDVANMTGRHRGEDLNAQVAHDLRATIADQRPDGILLAEHCHDASADLGGDGWHGAMNYSGFTRPLWAWLRRAEGFGASFLGVPTAMPRLGADGFQRAVAEFTAAAPWRSMATSWSLLGSHDTARIRTVVGDCELGEVAAGLLFTMPGVPMVFAGDEIGQEGVLGEDARRPFPWHRPDSWDHHILGVYRELSALRRHHHALRRGGLRWVHAMGDAMVLLRESPEERLLVLAARAAHAPVQVSAQDLGVTGEAANVYGGAEPLKIGSDATLTLPGDGPTFQVWQLDEPSTTGGSSWPR